MEEKAFEQIRVRLEKKINDLINQTKEKHNIRIIVQFKPLEEPPVKLTFVINVHKSHL